MSQQSALKFYTIIHRWQQTRYYFFVTLVFLFLTLTAFCQQPPPLQLANIYSNHINPKNYWVSEKLDGVRAYWNGKNLISRQGHRINAPLWFVENFPQEPLDGELWIGHNQFERVSGIIRQQNPNDAEWKKIRFMVFDMPQNPHIFTQRLEMMKKLIAAIHSEYLQVIPQYKVESPQELMQQLHTVLKAGGEGLMLHRETSHYQAVRNNDLLKLKAFVDAEAVVIAHIPGKGKYKNMLGALLVENSDKVRFKIGSGFSDAQRKNPPQIGSIITYKYFGKTKNNIPRFAGFVRIRYDLSTPPPQKEEE
ncbi:MAG TPA: DNA ligase [Gammaproteobacteria bacterium]|nr:DNA ligase [Gammaproteobacteria bacterium]